jgi:hypothetical protein
MSAREEFDSTISARYINDSWVDHISPPAFQNVGSFRGLSIYTQQRLASAKTTQKNLNAALQSLEQEINIPGVSFQVIDSVAVSKNSTRSNTKNASNYIGSTAGATADMLKDNLSQEDLSETSFNNVFQNSAAGIQLVANLNSILSEQESLTRSELKTKVDVLVGFVVPEFAVSREAYQMQYLGNKYVIREPRFETKTLADLLLDTQQDSNTYYLCRQKREGKTEVIDSFFLIRPSYQQQQDFMSAQDITTMASTFGDLSPTAATSEEDAPTLETAGEGTNGGY